MRLTSSNVAYTEEDSIFRFDVTVQNLRPELMGTADGSTPHEEGIRVFFSAGPTATAGSGSATVENPDGIATFTATNQAYYQYDEILATNEVSSPRTWRLHIEPTVTTFTFMVYVSTELQEAAAPSVTAVPVASGFDRPVYLTSPAGDDRLFVVEQTGRVEVIWNGLVLPMPFLDLSSRISSGSERGLLSLAFHPDYATNGYFYVNYTGLDGATVIERFTVSGNRNLADMASAYPILSIAQPESNHNGGLIKFGPDGMLYIGMGDGGGGGDPHENGQDMGTLLGKMLRIDVDGGAPYAIPSDNPFVGSSSTRPEIWASGLRNPWRFSFDHTADLLYIGDVGQRRLEEVNVVPATQAGVNYGWNTMEGTTCFDPSSGCDTAGLTLPVYEYPTSDGCAVTGGYVYRGSAMPELRGTYLYADYCSGQVSSFRYTGGTVSEHADWNLGDLGNVSSFGEDANRELYIIDLGGTVYRLERPSSGVPM